MQRYKSLADIERGFRVLKSEIEIAPVYHRLPERITEAMDETDGAETGVLGCIRATFDRRLPNRPHQDMHAAPHSPPPDES